MKGFGIVAASLRRWMLASTTVQIAYGNFN
jgi:hypothetical protein